MSRFIRTVSLLIIFTSVLLPFHVFCQLSDRPISEDITFLSDTGSHLSYEPSGFPDGYLFMQSIPVAFFEGFSLAAAGAYSCVFLPNAGAIIGGAAGLIGYPILTWNTLKWINHADSGARKRFSAFYVTGELQYASFRTSNAPPSPNMGIALEMWSPIYWRFGLRTGFHLSQRYVSLNHKFISIWDSEYVREENLTCIGIEYGGPVELLYLQPVSSRFDIFASGGIGILLLTDNENFKTLNSFPVGSHHSDYDVSDNGSPFPEGQRIWLAGIGLRTRHWLWELQYTVSDSEYRTVAGVMVEDPLYTFRLRIGYRIPFD